MARRMDTRNEGLDIVAHAARVFADTPWLHYGLWAEGERVSFPNLRAAQERYVEKLLSFLPPPPARVLDIGGGMGELAARLVERGYDVEMITPSATQIRFARERLGDRARLVQARFEDYAGDGSGDRLFDVCLWSESFQYVPLEKSLSGMKRVLAPEGVAVIADVFRRPDFAGGRAPGRGPRWDRFLEAMAREGYEILAEEDVTELVAPSLLLDQRFYREFASPVVSQLDASLEARRPMLHALLRGAYGLVVSRRRREALAARFKADYRSPQAFAAANSYRFLKLGRRAARSGSV